MRTIPLQLVSSLLGLLPAQDPPATTKPPATARPSAERLAAATQRLATALQKTAALTDTRFQASWAPDNKPAAGANQGVAVILGARIGGSLEGACRGSWHQDLLHLHYDGGDHDELLVVGRRMLAKDAQTPWCLRKDRFANGSELGFLPDPLVLLQRLATMGLTVTNREVGSLDDRPVEVLSTTLDQDQLTELLWSESLPASMAMNLQQVFRIQAGGGNQVRMGAPKPDAIVDLVVHLDPATSLVERLQFRSWTKDDAQVGRFVVVNGAGAVQAGDDEDEDDASANDGAANQPLRYENGLPARPRKKTNVMDFTVRLFEHGKVAPPTLDEAQRRLLGR